LYARPGWSLARDKASLLVGEQPKDRREQPIRSGHTVHVSPQFPSNPPGWTSPSAILQMSPERGSDLAKATQQGRDRAPVVGQDSPAWGSDSAGLGGPDHLFLTPFHSYIAPGAKPEGPLLSGLGQATALVPSRVHLSLKTSGTKPQRLGHKCQ
jgi:hypothetical protein